MSLAKKLKEIRKIKGMSLTKLSKLTGLSRTTITEIENVTNDRSPKTSTLDKLAEALEVSVEEFFKEDGSAVKGVVVVPSEFTDSNEARKYISMHQIFAAEGFNLYKMSDEDVLDFANALLEQMKMVSYKYKK